MDNISVIDKLSRFGLLWLASNNRDIFYGFNRQSKKELYDTILNAYVEGKDIKYPEFNPEHFLLKKSDENYNELRKQYLIGWTKYKYHNNPEFKEQMKTTTKNYYQKLKNYKIEFEKIKKNDLKNI
jgi:hypothetical protein